MKLLQEIVYRYLSLYTITHILSGVITIFLHLTRRGGIKFGFSLNVCIYIYILNRDKKLE